MGGGVLSLSGTFQSTPPRGWRHRKCGGRNPIAEFQSTPPRGWRRAVNNLSVLGRVSIHATTRVATKSLEHQFSLLSFQSTPPRGWRRWMTRKHSGYWSFNPRHHEGGDLNRSGSLNSFGCFNPRHHEGGDGGFPVVLPGATVSIHATTRVATRSALRNTMSYYVSIHATTRVATQDRHKQSSIDLFQSTPPRGWRQYKNYAHDQQKRFNPRHHEGGDNFSIPQFPL